MVCHDEAYKYFELGEKAIPKPATLSVLSGINVSFENIPVQRSKSKILTS